MNGDGCVGGRGRWGCVGATAGGCWCWVLVLDVGVFDVAM